MDPDRPNPSDFTMSAGDAVELELLVRRSDEDVALFDSTRIVETLVREAHLDRERAQQLSVEIRGFIERVGLRTLSSSVIRGLVDAKLLEYGMEDAHRAHARLGVPLYDVDRLMHGSRRDDVGRPHGPEGTSLHLAEAIKREFGIVSVLSEQSANAHLVGDIHILHLGSIDRPYSLTCSLDHVKRHGVVLPKGFANAAPARRPEVLVSHIVKFTAALQGYASGPIVWDSLNFGLAPFIENHSHRDLCQLAEMLLHDLSSPAVARGGQAISCDIHLDWRAPEDMASRPAVGPGGAQLVRTYSEYTEAAHRFLRAFFEVCLTGDARQRPFVSPRAILHINSRFTERAGYRVVLDLASRVATERGGLTIAFDRDGESAFFERFGVSDPSTIAKTETENWRSAALAAVAINLPRVGYLAGGDQVRVFEELTRVVEAAAQAHLEKRIFLEKLLARGEFGPLSLLAMAVAGKPFLRLAWTSHPIAPVGLNELARSVTGKELHADPAALEFGRRVVGHLSREIGRLSDKHRVRFLLSESSDGSTARRLARLDLRFFGSAAAEVMGADGAGATYTTGCRLAATAPLAPLDRLKAEGELHVPGLLNARSEIWFNATPPTAEQAALLISQGFYQSGVGALVFAPEFTFCNACDASATGVHGECPKCGSASVDAYALSGDRYNLIPASEESRRVELAHRFRTEF